MENVLGIVTRVVYELGWEPGARWLYARQSELRGMSFDETVPLLRRTFGAFESAERRQLGRLIAGAEREGVGGFGPGLDHARAEAALTTVRHLLGRLDDGRGALFVQHAQRQVGSRRRQLDDAERLDQRLGQPLLRKSTCYPTCRSSQYE